MSRDEKTRDSRSRRLERGIESRPDHDKEIKWITARENCRVKRAWSLPVLPVEGLWLLSSSRRLGGSRDSPSNPKLDTLSSHFKIPSKSIGYFRSSSPQSVLRCLPPCLQNLIHFLSRHAITETLSNQTSLKTPQSLINPREGFVQSSSYCSLLRTPTGEA